jgi:hypothetical protein
MQPFRLKITDKTKFVKWPFKAAKYPEIQDFEPNIFLKRLPGVGSEPGASQFHLFSHFHHFTAEPQRLPSK